MPICVVSRLRRAYSVSSRVSCSVLQSGFCDVDGLAALHRLHRHEAVHVIGHRDVHRVDVLVLLLEQLAPVLVDANLRESAAAAARIAAQIDVGDGDELERGMLGERHQVADSAWPDAPMLAWRSVGRPRGPGIGQERRGRRARRDGLEEAAPGDRWHRHAGERSATTRLRANPGESDSMASFQGTLMPSTRRDFVATGLAGLAGACAAGALTPQSPVGRRGRGPPGVAGQ